MLSGSQVDAGNLVFHKFAMQSFDDEDSDWSIFQNRVWIRAAKGRDLNEIRHICSYEGP
jgi:hypothetical protein